MNTHVSGAVTILFGLSILSLVNWTYAQGAKIEIAQSCTHDTTLDDKLQLQTLQAMVSVTGPETCINKSTRVGLVVDSIRANRRIKGSVELSLDSESSTQWSKIQETEIGKEMVLLINQKSVLYFRIFKIQKDGKLTLFAADKSEAETFAKVISGL